MKILRPKTVAISCLVVLLLGGCQTNPSRSENTAAADEFGTGGTSSTSSASDADQTRTEGAVMGAVIGGLLGLALGGDNRGQSAAIGAVVGAGAGYLVGNEIAKRKKKYATDEAFLDSEIASAREYNATARSYNQQLRGDIAKLDKDTRLLESRHKAGLASKDELARERKSVKQQIASSNKVYENLKKEYEIKVEVAKERRQESGNDVYVRQLDKEIAALKKNMDELQAQSVQLAQIDDRLTL